MKTLTLAGLTVLLMVISVPAAQGQLLQGIFQGILSSKITNSVNTIGSHPSAAPKQDIKVGDEAYTGQYRVAVSKVQTLNTYTLHYNEDPKQQFTIAPLTGQTLMVVDCYLKNATTAPQELVFSNAVTPDTVIMDDKHSAFKPLSVAGTAFEGYDIHVDELSPAGVKVAPGATINFAVVFAVPIGFKATDFVFSALNYGDRNNVSTKAADITVAL